MFFAAWNNVYFILSTVNRTYALLSDLSSYRHEFGYLLFLEHSVERESHRYQRSLWQIVGCESMNNPVLLLK